jgi:hypothetical protein
MCESNRIVQVRENEQLAVAKALARYTLYRSAAAPTASGVFAEIVRYEGICRYAEDVCARAPIHFEHDRRGILSESTFQRFATSARSSVDRLAAIAAVDSSGLQTASFGCADLVHAKSSASSDMTSFSVASA